MDTNDIIWEIGEIARKIIRYEDKIRYLKGQKEELFRILSELDG